MVKEELGWYRRALFVAKALQSIVSHQLQMGERT